MGFIRTPFIARVIRRCALLAVVASSMALGGCPLSNWSDPEINPAPAKSAPAPVVPAPPPAPPLPVPPDVPPPPASVPAPPSTAALPVATGGSLVTHVDTAKSGVLTGKGKDALSYAIVVPSVYGKVELDDASTGAFTYTPGAGYSGMDAFQFTVANAAGTSIPATMAITVTPATLGALNAPANIGTNLDGVVYYSFTQQYVDMMHMGSAWSSTSADTVHGAGVNLVQIGMLDAQGWPLEDAQINVGCCVVPDGSPASPGTVSPLVGSYALSFNGKANVAFLSGTVENLAYDAASNTSTATLVRAAGSGNGAGHMILTFSKTQRTAGSPIGSGITNVRMIRPQFAPNGVKWWDSPTQKFTNPFLATLKPFTTLRFMDWMITNGNQVADWNERTPADWPTASHQIKTNGAWEWNATTHKTESTDNFWSKTGQSWENAIELANLTGKDIWINVPVRATDDYVRSLATLFKQKLDPALHLYVEYSNEVWNSSFEQWYANDAVTKALLAGDTTAAANYGKNCISWANDTCHVAERLMQISAGFAQVFGPAAINTRVRPVFCHQLVGASSMQMALAYINNTYGAPSKYFYGICSAPYWGPDSVAPGESVDDLLAASAASIPKWAGYTLAYTATARYYGLHNFTYEAGTGMTDRSEIDLPNMLAANMDPRMGQEVTDALTGMFRNGVDMVMYFTNTSAWSKYGMWGATQDIFNLGEPKFHALQALSGQTMTRTLDVTAPDPSKAVPWPGTALPGTINAGRPVFGVIAGSARPLYQAAVSCSGTHGDLTDGCTLYTGRAQGNGRLAYLVVASRAGTYTVNLRLGSQGSAAEARFYVNQQAQGGPIAIAAAPSGTPGTATPFQVTLPSGVSLIGLEVTSGTLAVHAVEITN